RARQIVLCGLLEARHRFRRDPPRALTGWWARSAKRIDELREVRFGDAAVRYVGASRTSAGALARCPLCRLEQRRDQARQDELELVFRAHLRFPRLLPDPL